MPWIVVFDTNILISALLSPGGSPYRCLALARLGTIQSVTCREILNEFEEKLQAKFGYTANQAQAVVEEVRSFSQIVAIPNDLKVVTADPADNKILECAVVSGAHYVITGDRRHLLPLHSYQGIAITSATAFLALLPTS